MILESMRRYAWALLWLVIIVPAVNALEIQLDTTRIDLVSSHAPWRFHRGWENPPAGWTDLDFNDFSWDSGPAGFGYGDDDDATVLDDMRGAYLTVYVRTTFSIASLDAEMGLAIAVDYDDGFVAYINGKEVARRSLPDGPVDYQTEASSHEAGQTETIFLGKLEDWLHIGENVLAVEGHNVSLTSSDFSIHPALHTVTGTLRSDDAWIVDEPVAALSGYTGASEAVAVLVGETVATFNPTEGSWSSEIALALGLNRLVAVALNADGNEVDTGTLDIIYAPLSHTFSGSVVQDTTWSGAVILDGRVIVDANTVLTIREGSVVVMGDEAEIEIGGQLIADGNESAPILFTHYGDGTAWRQIRFVSDQNSVFSHCTFEHADSAGAHQDYYEPGPRDYHEALVVLAGHLELDHCVFQKLPVAGNQSEGDALAVISDDSEIQGSASATIRSCRFLGIGQGVHTRYSHVLVEDCFFTGKHGDNDDVDLYGESDPPAVIRHNLFLNPEHDDMINPTKCSAIIEGNIISGSDDHGIVLRDTCFPVLRNNLIMDCSSAGIAVENTCEALIVNNTIVNCGRGIRFLDLGRWGPPYRLAPGGGIATIVNCIVWDCDQPITLADSPNETIADPGSHATVLYSNIEGGRDGVSVGGSHSTLTWGAGNLDLDPLFVDPEHQDYRLQGISPIIDAGRPDDAPLMDLDGTLRPCGLGIDLGAYEYGDCLLPISD